jgi:hypothetical protein
VSAHLQAYLQQMKTREINQHVKTRVFAIIETNHLFTENHAEKVKKKLTLAYIIISIIPI